MKDVKNYEGLYSVTPEGEVYSYKSKKFLSPFSNARGYLKVGLCKNGKVKNFYVHRLVTDAYLPNPNNFPQVNHKDENKANNCLQNLELCDAKYNNNYGTHIEKIKKPILQYDLEGNLVREWPSATDVGKEVRSNICMCLKGKQKTALGYIWKYKEAEV